MKFLPRLPLVERVAAGSLRVWLMIGILLRVTRLRDGWGWLDLIFYSTPWPAIAFGLAVLALHAARLGHRHRVHRYVALTGGALFTWYALSWQSNPVTQETPTLRVAHWNTARPSLWRLQRMAPWLKAQDADVISIAEAEGRGKSQDWARQLPGYQLVQFPGEMNCLVRGEVLSQESGLLDDGSYYGLLHTRVRGRELTILQADIYGSPTHSRRFALAQLEKLVQAHAKERLIVVGDFNTPHDSVHFDAFRQELSPAFEKAGHGMSETWPMPVPMLTIDHLWSSHALRPLTARIAYIWWSDHRPIVAEFAEGP